MAKSSWVLVLVGCLLVGGGLFTGPVASASGQDWRPMQPVQPVQPVERVVDLRRIANVPTAWPRPHARLRPVKRAAASHTQPAYFRPPVQVLNAQAGVTDPLQRIEPRSTRYAMRPMPSTLARGLPVAAWHGPIAVMPPHGRSPIPAVAPSSRSPWTPVPVAQGNPPRPGQQAVSSPPQWRIAETPSASAIPVPRRLSPIPGWPWRPHVASTYGYPDRSGEPAPMKRPWIGLRDEARRPVWRGAFASRSAQVSAASPPLGFIGRAWRPSRAGLGQPRRATRFAHVPRFRPAGYGRRSLADARISSERRRYGSTAERAVLPGWVSTYRWLAANGLRVVQR